MGITAELDELLLSLEAGTERAHAHGHRGHQSPTQQVVAASITHHLLGRRSDLEQVATLEHEVAAWLTDHRMLRLRNTIHKQVESCRAIL